LGEGGPIHIWTLELRLGKPVFSMEFSYVYILLSRLDAKRFYIGLADDLRDRLRRHNGGEIAHTSRFRPWRFKTAAAFTD